MKPETEAKLLRHISDYGDWCFNQGKQDIAGKAFGVLKCGTLAERTRAEILTFIREHFEEKP